MIPYNKIKLSSLKNGGVKYGFILIKDWLKDLPWQDQHLLIKVNFQNFSLLLPNIQFYLDH